MHDCKYGTVTPKTRADFWSQKRQGTVLRDETAIAELKQQGWNVLVIWECQTKSATVLEALLLDFLGPSTQSA